MGRPNRISAHDRREPFSLKTIKVSCAIYGVSAVATFAWLFLRLSGASSCAMDWDICGAAAGSAGLLAVAWPVYWGGWALGTPLATPSISVEAISLEGGLALLLGFAAMIVFTLALKRLQ